MFHVEQFAPSVPRGTLLPWDRMRGTRIIGTSRDLAGLTGSQLPELKLCPFFGRNARRGEEEMFHVEHFDPAVGCSIWEHSPVGSQEKSSCCAPLGGGGKFPVLCSIWNVPARVFHVEHIRQFGDGLGIWNHDQETGSCALLGAGTCPGGGQALSVPRGTLLRSRQEFGGSLEVLQFLPLLRP